MIAFASNHCATSLPNRIDCEAFRRLAALRSFPHGGIGGLDVARKARGVEEDTGGAVAIEPGLERGEAIAVLRELQRQSLVFRKRTRDQFGKSGGPQQTCSDPPRE